MGAVITEGTVFRVGVMGKYSVNYFRRQRLIKDFHLREVVSFLYPIAMYK